MGDTLAQLNANLNALENRWNFSPRYHSDNFSTEVVTELPRVATAEGNDAHLWHHYANTFRRSQREVASESKVGEAKTNGYSASLATRKASNEEDITNLSTLLKHDIGVVQSFGAGVVLLAGEGDFSFARCLLDVHAAKTSNVTGISHHPKLIATSLDTEETITQRYQDAAVENIARLRKLGATVLHGFDATKIHENAEVGDILSAHASRGERLVIIFNFPHHCGKGRIDINRTLLYNFFACAGGIIRSYDHQRSLTEKHAALLKAKSRDSRNWPSEVYVSLAPVRSMRLTKCTSQGCVYCLLECFHCSRSTHMYTNVDMRCCTSHLSTMSVTVFHK